MAGDRAAQLGPAAIAGVEPWIDRLSAIHGDVRDAVRDAATGDVGTTNAKGDRVKAFDLAAHEAAMVALDRLGAALVVESEEGGTRHLGEGAPRWRVVVDPVDGSDNRARGLPLSAFSCAVLPVSGDLRPASVVAALVGPIADGPPWLAVAGGGAWRGGEPIRTSGVKRLADAFLSIELNHAAPSSGAARLPAAARGIRSYGCASMALALVAAGAIDAHVDLRRRLTAESYLAGARLVLEAGGTVSGADGRPLGAVADLTARTSVVAAATPELGREILERLDYEGSGSIAR